jgi:hypothetical protein
MGAGQSKNEEEQVGATAPSIPEKEEGTPPTMIGGRRKTRGRKTRKSRKGKRHGRK